MHVVLAANPRADQPWVAEAAAQLAKQTGASIAVVSVDDVEPGAQMTLPRSAYQEYAEAAADRALERLQAAGVPATKTVIAGAALPSILDFAEERKADLIVVGSSTRGPLATRLLGSVSLGLLEHSRRPVLVITHPASET